MTLTIQVDQDPNETSKQLINFTADNAETYSTADAVNILMYVADQILNETQKQKDEQKSLQLV